MLAEIVLSSINPLFFRTVVRKSAVRAFVYYLVFTTLYTLAFSGFGLWWALRNWTPALETARKAVPPFEVNLTQGHLSTTLPEPFVISDPDFTLIVDTSGKPLDSENYEKAILISQTKAVFKKNLLETREYNFAALSDFRLTTDELISWLTANRTVILWSVFSVMAFLVFPVAWLLLIPVLFFLALVLMVPSKIFKTSLQYGQVLSIAFYAVTLPTLVQTYLLTRGMMEGGVFWGIYLLWAVLGVAICRSPANASIPETSSPVSS